MRAAVLESLGSPSFGVFDEPVPSVDCEVISVKATAINPIDIAMARGHFYTGPPVLPSVVGQEGVGVTPDGRRAYFCTTVSPFGAMAEKALVRADELICVPDDIDDIQIVSIGNAGLAAWLALTLRARLQPGESVLILGASGMVGRMAVQAARILGAGTIIAATRTPELHQDLYSLGATEVVGLEALDEGLGPTDVVVDLLWGPYATKALGASRTGMRYIQVGNAAGPSAQILAGHLRPAGVQIIGHANFATSVAARSAALNTALHHTRSGDLQVPISVFPLEQVERAWSEQATTRQRLILTP